MWREVLNARLAQVVIVAVGLFLLLFASALGAAILAGSHDARHLVHVAAYAFGVYAVVLALWGLLTNLAA